MSAPATILQTQTDLGSLGATITAAAKILADPTSTDQDKVTALLTAGSALGAVGSDLESYINDHPAVAAAAKASGLLSAFASIRSLNTDFAQAKAAVDAGQPIPEKIQLDILGNFANLAAVGTMFVPGLGEVEGAVRGFITLAQFAGTLTSSISAFIPDDPSPPAVIPGVSSAPTQTTFANGYTGGWVNNNDGTSSYRVTDSNGNVVNQITIDTPSGALPVIGSQGGQVQTSSGDIFIFDNQGRISEQFAGGNSQPEYGDDIAGNVIVTLHPNANNGPSAVASNDDGDTGSYSANGNVSTTSSTTNGQTSSETITANNGNFSESVGAGGNQVNFDGIYLAGGSSPATYDASALGAKTILDVAGGNTLTTGGAQNITLIGADGDTPARRQRWRNPDRAGRQHNYRRFGRDCRGRH